MSIHLQQMRVTHTTANVSDAGTDDRVDLRFFIDPNSLTTYPFRAWRTIQLDSARDDRRRGVTESYDVDFREGDIGISISGTTVPRGIAFESFARVRCAAFFLVIRGSDWWRAQNYQVDGFFQELRFVPGTIDSFETINHGWLAMSVRSTPLDMSTDSSEGITWHHLIIDGALPV